MLAVVTHVGTVQATSALPPAGLPRRRAAGSRRYSGRIRSTACNDASRVAGPPTLASVHGHARREVMHALSDITTE
jgi:hypothetical protein